MKEPMTPSPCRVCGGNHFAHHDVLWSDLIAQWGLSRSEADYINVQQGTCCIVCGANIRSIALADAILRHARATSTLKEWVEDDETTCSALLEINEAGSLTGVLEKLRGHRLVRYPEYNMMALPFENGSFDLIVHSDTLEHVPDPAQGLRECRRLLRPGGACIFTVPVVVRRLTRGRKGLPLSVHGSEGCTDSSLTVHSEFGADVWCHVLESGFDDCRMVPYWYPAGIAIVAGVSEELNTKGGQR
jgi:Methylase involved in ubiquinone/menaquinone biosynthesis